jgi:hypothetical protein
MLLLQEEHKQEHLCGNTNSDDEELDLDGLKVDKIEPSKVLQLQGFLTTL